MGQSRTTPKQSDGELKLENWEQTNASNIQNNQVQHQSNLMNPFPGKMKIYILGK